MNRGNQPSNESLMTPPKKQWHEATRSSFKFIVSVQRGGITEKEIISFQRQVEAIVSKMFLGGNITYGME